MLHSHPLLSASVAVAFAQPAASSPVGHCALLRALHVKSRFVCEGGGRGSNRELTMEASRGVSKSWVPVCQCLVYPSLAGLGELSWEL